jgi:hypothetical protein
MKIEDELCKELGFDLASSQSIKVRSWIRKNFEVLGQENYINDYVLERMEKTEIKKHIEYDISRRFSDKLIEFNNFVISDRSDKFTKVTRYEMMVLRIPKE